MAVNSMPEPTVRVSMKTELGVLKMCELTVTGAVVTASHAGGGEGGGGGPGGGGEGGGGLGGGEGARARATLGLVRVGQGAIGGGAVRMARAIGATPSDLPPRDGRDAAETPLTSTRDAAERCGRGVSETPPRSTGDAAEVPFGLSPSPQAPDSCVASTAVGTDRATAAAGTPSTHARAARSVHLLM